MSRGKGRRGARQGGAAGADGADGETRGPGPLAAVPRGALVAASAVVVLVGAGVVALHGGSGAGSGSGSGGKSADAAVSPSSHGGGAVGPDGGGGTSGGGSASAAPSGASGPSAAPSATGGSSGDVAVSSCTVDPDLHWADAKLAIRNGGQVAADYSAQVEFLGSDGSVLDTGYAAQNGVAAGSSVTTDAPGSKALPASAGKVTCRISRVERVGK
ncbi:hypothetical protein BIV57_17175 [Mangrovactinospora gilvigrisea]|uniref:Uncharacterized protein n=1 Tax=Mangrovactinospora gilvigrisea TaxID=1428644 RepID=A0A1J7C3X1_9ACTN|nr:hypothetical protein [Mangrovactinospora gilvigrisea]OIV36260.1 hypothetical protein BIV57_17175 [Mangrovactinospora gilvigrisea]